MFATLRMPRPSGIVFRVINGPLEEPGYRLTGIRINMVYSPLGASKILSHFSVDNSVYFA